MYWYVSDIKYNAKWVCHIGTILGTCSFSYRKKHAQMHLLMKTNGFYLARATLMANENEVKPVTRHQG